MATQIGSLEFDVILKNGTIEKQAKQTEAIIKGMAQSGTQSVETLDESFIKVNGSMRDTVKELQTVNKVDLSGLESQLKNVSAIQKDALKNLDNVYKENALHIKALNDELGKLNANDEGAAEKLANLKAEIAARQDLNTEIETQRKEIENETITQRLKLIQREMQNLYDAGQQDTEMYQKLLEEAGRLSDIRGDVAAQTAVLADDEANIRATTAALGGVNSALGTAKSGMDLLGTSSTELTKAMTSLNSVQGIFNGLQTISATLNRDSYARRMANIAATKLQTLVTNLLGKAHLSEAAAAKVATVATAAATAGLTLLIPILYSVITKFREFQKANEDINKGMADAGAPAIVSLELLSQKWNELGDNMEEKRRFVAENQSEFEKLGASVNGVADAEKLLVDGKDTFVATIMARAQATAAYNVLVEKQSELLQEQLNLGTVDANGNFQGNTSWHWGTEGHVNEAMAQTGANRYSDENLKRANELRFQELQREYQEFSNNITNIIKEAEKKIKEGEDELGSVITDKKRTDDYIANLKKQKAVFDNYKASLNSDNQGVKSFFSKELKKLQSEFGTSATTWRQFLEEMKKDPKNVGNYDIIKSINEQLLADNSDPLKELMERQKKNYADYAKLTNSTSAEIRDNAQTVYASLLKQGANYEEYLKNLREKYKGNAAAIKKINMEIIETEREGLMDIFNNELDKNMLFAQDVADQLKVIEDMRKKIADNDPQKREKNQALDDKAKSILGTSNSDLANAQKAYQEYLNGLLPETERYQRQIQKIRLQIEKETDKQIIETLNNEMQAAEIRLQMAQNKQKIDNAKELAAQLVRIEEKRAADIAAIDEDAALSAAEKARQKAEAEEYANADIAILKGQFADVDGGFIAQILNATKEATAGQLELFVDMINEIQAQLTEMETSGNQDSEAYIVLKSKLDMAKNAYETFKTESKRATAGLAKDKNLAKVAASLQELGTTLQSIGGMFEGVIGEVMEMTGQMLTAASSIITSINTLTNGTIKGIEMSSKAATAAIRAVETASVILAIIEAAMQVAMSLINLFQKDEQTYEDRKNVYKSYLSTLDKVIEREKALMNTMTNAQDIMRETGNVSEMYAKQREQTQRLLDEYLHKGTKGKKENRGHTVGYTLGEKMTSQDLADVQALGINMDSRVNNLVGLTASQIRDLQQYATSFYSKLDDETRDYLEKIVELDDAAADLMAEESERITGISFDGFTDNFKSALLDMNATAEDLGATITDTIQEKLISNLVDGELNKDLKRIYDYYDEAMRTGNGIDSEEIRTINKMKDETAQAALKRRNEIMSILKQDPTDEIESNTLSGAIKGASQESIDLLAGQTNAVRMNQVEQIAIVKQQLAGLTTINTSIVKNGLILNEILSEMRSGGNLRAQGLEI